MTDIEVFADIVCPFTHLGLLGLFAERGRRGSTRAIRVRAWPLELVNGSPLDPALVAHEIEALRAVAPATFKGFDGAHFPATSIPAFGLAAAGYAVDDATGEALSLALRAALFERGLDVGNPDIIEKIAADAGVRPLDPARAEAAVRADWERGSACGVAGSPHIFLGDRSWFCPSLRIAKVGGHFEVAKAGQVRAFYDAVFA